MKIVLWCLVGALLTAGWIAFRVRWWQRMHYQSLIGRSLPPEQVKRRLRELLVELDRVFSAGGITYWLDWGTLLGAYRHRGFIPWDDDLDVTIPHSDHERAYALRHEFGPGLELVLISQIWSVDKVIPGLARLWPCSTFLRLLDTRTKLYVDIFEVSEAESQKLTMLPLSRMHPQRDYRGQRVMIDQAHVFPLDRVEFEGAHYPAPRDARSYLQRLFGEDLSPDRELDPKTGRWVKRKAERGTQKAES
jgi:hypothetical protein